MNIHEHGPAGICDIRDVFASIHTSSQVLP